MLRRLAILLLVLPAPAYAQVIRGTILDPASGARLSVVDIRVSDRAGRLLLSAVSNQSGEFALPVRAADEVRLHFERIGYQPATTELLTVKSGEVLELEVHLVPSAVPLQPITVRGRRQTDQRLVEFYDRATVGKRTGFGRFWTRADLDRHPGLPISHLLRTVPSRSSCDASEVYVDGLPLSMTPATSLAAARNAQPDSSSEMQSNRVVDWLVDPDDVEGIEVYRDFHIPPEYNPGGQFCQVTLIWRRPYHGQGMGLRQAGSLFGALGLGAALGWLLTLLR